MDTHPGTEIVDQIPGRIALDILGLLWLGRWLVQSFPNGYTPHYQIGQFNSNGINGLTSWLALDENQRDIHWVKHPWYKTLERWAGKFLRPHESEICHATCRLELQCIILPGGRLSRPWLQQKLQNLRGYMMSKLPLKGWVGVVNTLEDIPQPWRRAKRRVWESSLNLLETDATQIQMNGLICKSRLCQIGHKSCDVCKVNGKGSEVKPVTEAYILTGCWAIHCYCRWG